MDGPPIFLRDYVYELAYEYETGSPVVMLPRRYAEALRASLSSNTPDAIYYLVGDVRGYRETPRMIYTITHMVRDVNEFTTESSIVGVACVMKKRIADLENLSKGSCDAESQVFIIASAGSPLEAIILSDSATKISAGLFVFGPPTPARVETINPPKPIRITKENLTHRRLNGSETSKHSGTVVTVEPKGLAFPPPRQIICAYCGHRITGAYTLCDACKIPICKACSQQTSGCITVDCVNNSEHSSPSSGKT